MSNRSLNRLVLPSLTTSGNTSATGSGANSDTESPIIIGTGINTGLGLVGGENNNNKKGGLDLNKFEIFMPMPVSPVSSLGSDDLGDDKFFIRSPVSPLSPRGSPKSNRGRL